MLAVEYQICAIQTAQTELLRQRSDIARQPRLLRGTERQVADRFAPGVVTGHAARILARDTDDACVVTIGEKQHRRWHAVDAALCEPALGDLFARSRCTYADAATAAYRLHQPVVAGHRARDVDLCAANTGPVRRLREIHRRLAAGDRGGVVAEYRCDRIQLVEH